MSGPPDPKNWLLDRVHYIRTLLREVTTPRTGSPSQEDAHAEYFRRLDLLELGENTKHLETQPVCKSDAMEFKHLKDSILNLEREAFIAYTNFCTQEAHNTRPATTQPHPWNLGTNPTRRTDYTTLTLSSRGQK